MTTTMEENPLDGFRYYIAQRFQEVAQTAGISLPEEYQKDAHQLAAQFEKAKTPETTFSVPIPKLKIPGNPTQIAQTMAEKVFNFSIR